MKFRMKRYLFIPRISGLSGVKISQTKLRSAIISIVHYANESIKIKIRSAIDVSTMWSPTDERRILRLPVLSSTRAILKNYQNNVPFDIKTKNIYTSIINKSCVLLEQRILFFHQKRIQSLSSFDMIT